MNNPGIKMVSNNILVYVPVPNNETEAGIIVSEETASQMQTDIIGEIISIGPDVDSFTEGDKILLPPHGNTPISYKGEVFHVFRETTLFAKVDE